MTVCPQVDIVQAHKPDWLIKFPGFSQDFQTTQNPISLANGAKLVPPVGMLKITHTQATVTHSSNYLLRSPLAAAHTQLPGFIHHRDSPVRMWGNTPAFPCLCLVAACRKKAGVWLLEGICVSACACVCESACVCFLSLYIIPGFKSSV